MNTPIKALLFDFDGTLASTQPILQQALIDILRKLYPGPTHALDLDVTKDWWGGKSNNVIFKEVEARYNIALPSNIDDRFLRRAQERLGRDPLKWADDALKPLLDSLSTRFRMAVASNGEHKIVHANIVKVGGENIFPPSNVYTIASVSPGRSKPQPDMFNLAAANFNVAPDECLVIGDSFTDLGGAQKAGMQFVGYVGCASDPDAAEKNLKDLGADIVIRHYRDFPAL